MFTTTSTWRHALFARGWVHQRLTRTPGGGRQCCARGIYSPPLAQYQAGRYRQEIVLHLGSDVGIHTPSNPPSNLGLTRASTREHAF